MSDDKKEKPKVFEPSKSPLEGFMGWHSSMTEEEQKAWADKFNEKMDEAVAARKEQERRKREEPPACPTGLCVICGGTIKGEHRRESTIDHDRIPCGPGSSAYYAWRFKGYSCEDCGISYKKLPSSEIIERLKRSSG